LLLASSPRRLSFSRPLSLFSLPVDDVDAVEDLVYAHLCSFFSKGEVGVSERASGREREERKLREGQRLDLRTPRKKKNEKEEH
jgi:hypothetical protein